MNVRAMRQKDYGIYQGLVTAKEEEQQIKHHHKAAGETFFKVFFHVLSSDQQKKTNVKMEKGKRGSDIDTDE